VTWDSPIKQWSRPVRFVPEYMPLSELLPLMQRSHQAMVIVVDEYGGTAGLITLEDVVEEIIGESPDLPTADTLRIEKLDEQTYLVPAQMDLEEVNDFLDFQFPSSEEYNSLGGFLIYRLQKIPETGESLVYKSLLLTVEKSQGPRLDLIRITYCPSEDSSSEIDIALPETLESALDLSSLSGDPEMN
jgi:CBS domain containing-hemolysin-like protein